MGVSIEVGGGLPGWRKIGKRWVKELDHVCDLKNISFTFDEERI